MIRKPKLTKLQQNWLAIVDRVCGDTSNDLIEILKKTIREPKPYLRDDD